VKWGSGKSRRRRRECSRDLEALLLPPAAPGGSEFDDDLGGKAVLSCFVLSCPVKR
jgi:hypothetical protein